MSNNYKEDLVIDQFSLDKEWRQQSLLYAHWAEKAVDASFEYDKAKERLDVTRAELDMNIRKDPLSFGIEKVTEGSIQSTIIGNAIFQEASNKLFETKRDAKLLEVARDSFEHRKRALEKLTDLFLSKYYSEPYVSEPAKKLVEGQSKEGTQNALNESMKGRKLLRRSEG